MEKNKELVHDFWNDASCGENLYLHGDTPREAFNNQLTKRYELEPYIIDFADFAGSQGKKVLEIGVGLGADHQKFAESGAQLWGCDLTSRAIEYTQKRLELFSFSSTLQTADAENLPYENGFFDKVYSWGVIHHSPNTPQAVNEIYRVCKPGGEVKVMIYHTYSIIGFMLWLRYALLKGKPFMTLREVYDKYLESPGTKAYTVEEAQKIFSSFSQVKIKTVLTHGDLLTSEAGQRHQGILLNIARLLWPRFLIRTFFPTKGLFMMISAQK